MLLKEYLKTTNSNMALDVHVHVHMEIVTCSLQSSLFASLSLSLPPPPLRSVSHIDELCSDANSKLHQLSALLRNTGTDLSLLDYDTSNRANPEVLQALTESAKALKVSSSLV